MKTTSPKQLSKILVRIHDELYNLTEFADRHPGGEQVIRCFHKRDATIAFETHHRKDVHVKKMLAGFMVSKSEGKELDGVDIPPMSKIDQEILQLNQDLALVTMTHDEAFMFLLKPFLAFVLGSVMIIMCSKNYYWIGCSLLTFAAIQGLAIGHNLHHQNVFASPSLNRSMNTWLLIVLCGFHGGAVYREHGGHHAHTNIVDADPALNIPVIRWRSEQVLNPMLEDHPFFSQLNRAILFALFILISPYAAFFAGFGYQPLFPWFAQVKNDPMITKWTIVGLISRMICMVCLVGPFAAFVAPFLGMALIGGTTSTANHFDQPVALLQEVIEGKWTFARMILEGEHAFEEPDLGSFGKCPEWTTGIVSEHIYHHFLPSLPRSYLPKSHDKVDTILARFGIRIHQRSITEAVHDSFSVFSKMPLSPCSSSEVPRQSSGSSSSKIVVDAAGSSSLCVSPTMRVCVASNRYDNSIHGFGPLIASDGNEQKFHQLRKQKIDFLRNEPDQ